MVDQDLFTEKFFANKNLVYRMIKRYKVDPSYHDDLFQSIALNAWKGYPNFRHESTFTSWLGDVSKYVIISWQRKKWVRTEWLSASINIAGDSYRRIKPVLTSLSPLELKTFLLYAEGYNYNEMEQIMGEPGNRLRVRMNRIRAELRRYN